MTLLGNLELSRYKMLEGLRVSSRAAPLATNTLMKLVERVLKVKIIVEGEENIPKTNSILFVANHFTRFETFLVPYVLNDLCGKFCRSLADGALFHGTLGKYLEKLHAVSTSDPYRDDTIIHDLVTGAYNWIIYPEGFMVKGKKIYTEPHIPLFKNFKISARTGSAVLAIKAEIIRSINHLYSRGLCRSDSVQVCPISISYSNIYPTHNMVYQLVKLLSSKVSDRLKEEILIESNILLKSEIKVRFSKPIDVASYIQDRTHSWKIGAKSSSQNRKQDPKRTEKIVESTRYRLSYDIMQRVYGGIEITFDHFVATLVHGIIENHIPRNPSLAQEDNRTPVNTPKPHRGFGMHSATKALSAAYLRSAYVTAKIKHKAKRSIELLFTKNKRTERAILRCTGGAGGEVSMDSKIFFEMLFGAIVDIRVNHKEINLSSLLSSASIFRLIQSDIQNFKPFEQLLEGVRSQDYFRLEGSEIIFRPRKIFEARGLHSIRIHNTFQVLHNEASYFGPIKSIARKMTRLRGRQLKDKVLKSAIQLDSDDFLVDYYKTHNEETSMPITNGMPALFGPRVTKVKGLKYKAGIVVSHGFRSCPKQMEEYCKYMSKHGILCYNIRLKGHGTNAEDMSTSTQQDWINSYRAGIEIVSRACHDVYLAGFSLGGILALNLSSEYAGKIAGCLPISPAIRISDIRFKFVKFAYLWSGLMEKLSRSNKGYMEASVEFSEISYTRQYFSCLMSLSNIISETESKLEQVNTAILITHSIADPAVSPRSCDEIFKRIKSRNKSIQEVEINRHNITYGKGSSTIYRKIYEFIKQQSEL